MKITAQEEYGLRCLLAVAKNYSATTPLAISEIAKQEGLSTQYVAKLLNILRQHDLVVSVRGLCGGFKLAKAPHEISAIEVLQALGGGFEIDDKPICSSFSGKKAKCVHLPQCSIRPMWLTIIKHVTEFLQTLTIADFLNEEATAKQNMSQYMQNITQLETVTG